MNTKKAVIVAAGISSRLYPLTLETPKCLIEINSVALLKRSVLQLRKNGIDQIAVVVGFHRQKVMDAMKDIPRVYFIFNPFFKETNNLASLGLARSFIEKDSFFISSPFQKL
jgi:L-glutamine-phosphate cytidylyltransferase